MIKSKFSLWVTMTFFVVVILSAVNYLIFSKILLADDSNISFGVLLFIGILFFTWIWLVFGELRTKIIKVTIESKLLSIKKIGGIGRKVQYELDEFEGYKTCLLPSKYKTYEYLYLIKNGKKKMKISQFYHSNYSEMKIELRKSIKFLGQENFNYITELREIFQ